MDKAELTMINNLKLKTGKPLEEWILLIQAEKLEKHSEILKFLKEKHSFTHGYAVTVANKALKSDADSVEDKGLLVEKQYKGKEHLLPIYNRLIAIVQEFGDDIEVSPKNTYVSLRRKKQFATLNPASKTRFEIAFNFKGQEEKGILEAVKTANAMCSHKINITQEDDLVPEVVEWLRFAYEKAS